MSSELTSLFGGHIEWIVVDKMKAESLRKNAQYAMFCSMLPSWIWSNLVLQLYSSFPFMNDVLIHYPSSFVAKWSQKF